MIGQKKFNLVSNASASKQARKVSRLILCAFSVRHHLSILGVGKHIDAYVNCFKKENNDSSTRNTRMELLHQFVFVQFLSRFSSAEYLKRLLIRHFFFFLPYWKVIIANWQLVTGAGKGRYSFGSCLSFRRKLLRTWWNKLSPSTCY